VPAYLAAVDYRPFAALAYPHANGFHCTPAIGLTVAGGYIQVLAGQAMGAMVAVVGACAVGYHHMAAHLAFEWFVIGVLLVVPLLIQLSFILSVQMKRLLFLGVANKREVCDF